MNNTICECKNPIAQATLNHICQNCYKVLREYAMNTLIIICNKNNVTEISVKASPDTTIRDLCGIVFEHMGSKSNLIDCLTKGLTLDMLLKDLKYSLILKWKKEDKNWILFRT